MEESRSWILDEEAAKELEGFLKSKFMNSRTFEREYMHTPLPVLDVPNENKKIRDLSDDQEIINVKI